MSAKASSSRTSMRKNTRNTGIAHNPSQEQLATPWPPPPPVGETELEKALRVQEEMNAATRSAEIDQAIEQDRLEIQKKRDQIKILLLGQAESGKSTILKNFQLKYAPKAFQKESQAWRAVIHHNLLSSVNFILDLIAGSASNTTSDQQTIIEPDSELRTIKMRLGPLKEVEDILSREISADKVPTRRLYPETLPSNDRVYVRGGSGWKSLLGMRSSDSGTGSDHLSEARRIIDACKEDIALLWNHPAVQAVVLKPAIALQLQEQANFFLSDAIRVSSLDYQPALEDILRARLGTMGVEEHRLVLETEGRDKEYIIYDVGGSRSQRAFWAPYFDDVSVIIFLVPISAFNQNLEEAGDVNRLADSFGIWNAICGSKAISNITIILLLNKFDLLAQKLDSGIMFSKHVTSYKGQPNDADHVAKYLKAKFVTIHKQQSPRRPLYTHITCAIDMEGTSMVLARIRETLLRSNLSKTDLI